MDTSVAKYSINLICDYIIHRLKSDDNHILNNLKLQKLLYYCQAWHLAVKDGQPLFNGSFQAWIHGPVNREIYDRFKVTKSLYADIGLEDIQYSDEFSKISEDDKKFVDAVLETYAKYTGTQLEYMTHKETPWMEARTHYSPVERCEIIIKEETMASYYRQRLSK